MVIQLEATRHKVYIQYMNNMVSPSVSAADVSVFTPLVCLCALIPFVFQIGLGCYMSIITCSNLLLVYACIYLEENCNTLNMNFHPGMNSSLESEHII